MSKKVEFSWEIEEFSSLKKEVGEKIVSPTFYVGVVDGFHTQWRLELYPDGNSGKHQGRVSVYLTLMRSNFTAVTAHFELWFSKYSGGTLVRYPAHHEFHLLDGTRDWGFNSMSSRLLMNDFLCKDKLTVHCNVEIVGVSGTFLGKVALSLPSRTENPYWKMYTEKRLTDLTIIVDRKEFKVHRLILSAHSPVFAAMFEHQMMENMTHSLTITDYEATVVEKFIEFVYTKNCENLDEHSIELLSLADKYDFEVLKTECEIILARNLTEENSASLLLLADMYNASLLKNKALNFKEKKSIAVCANPMMCFGFRQ